MWGEIAELIPVLNFIDYFDMKRFYITNEASHSPEGTFAGRRAENEEIREHADILCPEGEWGATLPQ